jgi:hypothetical protein
LPRSNPSTTFGLGTFHENTGVVPKALHAAATACGDPESRSAETTAAAEPAATRRVGIRRDKRVELPASMRPPRIRESGLAPIVLCSPPAVQRFTYS